MYSTCPDELVGKVKIRRDNKSGVEGRETTAAAAAVAIFGSKNTKDVRGRPQWRIIVIAYKFRVGGMFWL